MMPKVVSTVIRAQRTKPPVTTASQNARKREWPGQRSGSAGLAGAASVDLGSEDKSAIPYIESRDVPVTLGCQLWTASLLGAWRRFRLGPASGQKLGERLLVGRLVCGGGRVVAHLGGELFDVVEVDT